VNKVFELVVVRGITEVVALLLNDPRVDPNKKDMENEGTTGKCLNNSILAHLSKTVLQVAALNGYLEVAKLLLKDERIDPNEKDNNGRTGKVPLCYL
jgi:hypothetical protein